MYFFFLGLITYLAVTPRSALLHAINDARAESDDDKLNQALLLVDILKSEYLRLLRGRPETPEGDNDAAEQSTCATTAGDGSANVTSSSTPKDVATHQASRADMVPTASLSVLEASRVPVVTAGPYNFWQMPEPATTAPSRRFYNTMPRVQQPYILPYRHPYFRRNLPDYFYYYDANPRRLDAEAGVGPFRRVGDYYDDYRKAAEKKKVETGKGQTNEKPTKVTTRTTLVFSRKLTRSKTSTQAGNDGNLRRLDKQPQRAKKRPYKSRKNDANQTNDTVTTTTTATTESNRNSITNNTAITVTSTLANTSSSSTAISTTTTSTTTKSTNSSTSKSHFPFNLNVSSTSTEKWPAFSFKPTLRVFLENSTPLPIPLPVNNAFCFTNPTNALCRAP